MPACPADPLHGDPARARAVRAGERASTEPPGRRKPGVAGRRALLSSPAKRRGTRVDVGLHESSTGG
ncbi:hypothetical protein [Streptomyces sp. NPDC051576]|uniref:hypothetical protein n=1 Tax=Streptomyces sp. NPDC051576 TaxID=3155803 RepID=UPI003446AC37